jgi:hypothetical protein
MDSKRLHFEKSKSYPLGNDDIMELIDLEPSNIFTSEKLESVNNIDELLDRLGRGVLLWRTENENTGHWISLLRKGNTIEIFDPYGNKPSEWTKKLNSEKGLNPPNGVLEKLIKGSGYKIKINNVKHQPINNSNSATCGKHTAIRLLFHKMNLDEYNNFMKDIKKKYGINSEDLVNAFSLSEINK